MKEQDLYNTLRYVKYILNCNHLEYRHGFGLFWKVRSSVRTQVRTMQIQIVMCLLLPGNGRSTLTCWLTPHLSSLVLICPACGLQQPTSDFLDRRPFSLKPCQSPDDAYHVANEISYLWIYNLNDVNQFRLYIDRGDGTRSGSPVYEVTLWQLQATGRA